MGTVEAGGGEAVAILNRNEPAFYCIPAERYEALLDYIDDLKLIAEVKERIEANEPPVRARIVGEDIEFEGQDA